MVFKNAKRLIFCLLAVMSAATMECNAQAIWELGVKGGTDFYLGDKNSTIFNDLQAVWGIYARYNWNCRWATKLQFASGNIDSPIDQDYTDVSVQQEFNFFEYGLKGNESWTKNFSPYICGGFGIYTFDGINDKSNIQLNIPFGVGVKCKVLKYVNIGLEWTLHKLFTDQFDKCANPYEYDKTSNATGNDWYSMCTLMLGIDLGQRGKYCK
jgi:hypothetical protein